VQLLENMTKTNINAVRDFDDCDYFHTSTFYQGDWLQKGAVLDNFMKNYFLTRRSLKRSEMSHSWIQNPTRPHSQHGSQNTRVRTGVVYERGLNIQYRWKVSWQFLEARYSKLDSRSSILENFKVRGSSWVLRHSRRVVNLSRPLENLSSWVSRLSSGKNKRCFVWLTFDTSES